MNAQVTITMTRRWWIDMFSFLKARLYDYNSEAMYNFKPYISKAYQIDYMRKKWRCIGSIDRS